MYRMRRTLAAAALGLVALALHGAPLPYDEAADANAAVQQALAQARAAQRRVLVVFGANWCEDCRALDAAMAQPANATQLAHDFVVVKVDVGRFDRNRELTDRYGQPTKKGIPAAVVLSADERVLYATRAGELANARRMSATGVADFFRQAAASAGAAR